VTTKRDNAELLTKRGIRVVRVHLVFPRLGELRVALAELHSFRREGAILPAVVVRVWPGHVHLVAAMELHQSGGPHPG
jgi:hypothetical protein